VKQVALRETEGAIQNVCVEVAAFFESKNQRFWCFFLFLFSRATRKQVFSRKRGKKKKIRSQKTNELHSYCIDFPFFFLFFSTKKGEREVEHACFFVFALLHFCTLCTDSIHLRARSAAEARECGSAGKERKSTLCISLCE
jgi:hypothetical protein